MDAKRAMSGKLCGDEKRYGYLPLSFLLNSWPPLMFFHRRWRLHHHLHLRRHHHQVMVSGHTRKIVTNRARVRKTCGPIGLEPLLNCIISLEFSLNTPAGLLFLFACHNNGRGKAITKFLQCNKNPLLTYLCYYTMDGGHHHVKLFTFTRVLGRKSLLQRYSEATLKWCDSHRRDYCFACSSTPGTNVAAH